MKAEDIMTSRSVWSCSETTTCREAAEMMSMRDIGSLPITDADGKVIGMVTDRDITCRLVAQGKSSNSPVGEVMSGPVFCCHPQTPLAEIESMMSEYRVRRLPVVDEERRLIGIVSICDLCRHCRGLMKERGVVETLGSVSAS